MMRKLQFILFGLMSGIIASTYFIVHFKTKRSLITRTNEIAHSYNIHSWQDFVPWSSKEKKKKIIYNRVGKCGSRSMIQIMTTLASKHNFIVIGSTNYKILHIDLRKQVEFVTFIDELQAPFIYHHHIHYIDFLRFGALQPVYINLIRDPLSRLVSSYYYLRFGDHREGHRSWHFKGTEEEKNQTFDECVLNERPECTSPSRLFYIIPYFCGVEPSCRQPSQQALNQAKINVIKNYLVVGITSEFEDFLSVLEKLLPEFFTGALEIYKQPGDDLKSRMTTTKTANKKGPSAEVVEIMRKRLRLEYEFYDFVRDRFHRIKHEVLEKQRR